MKFNAECETWRCLSINVYEHSIPRQESIGEIEIHPEKSYDRASHSARTLSVLIENPKSKAESYFAKGSVS